MEDFGFEVLIMCEQVLLLKQNPQVEWKRIKNDAMIEITKKRP